MKEVSWIITIIGACMGLYILFNGLPDSNGFHHDAGAEAIACAIIPYCIARAITELGNANPKKTSL